MIGARRRKRSRFKASSRRAVLAGVLASVLAVGLTTPAQADGKHDAVVEWIDRTAVPLKSTDPSAPLGDLGALRNVVGRATVVGLGESSHGSREQFRVKHRMVRFLVEHMGFRTVGLEHDFAHGVLLDRYVTTGEGDPRQLVEGMGFPFWICEEILDLVQWMRSYNLTHDEKVRFLGTDVIALRKLSFDEVTGYVRRVAPDRLSEVESLLEPLEPKRPDHTSWYRNLPVEKRLEMIDNARRVSRVVHQLPETAPKLEREYAEQHARTIFSWHEAFFDDTFRPPREVFIADTIGWWQRITGTKVAYWAASAHSTKAPSVTYRHPGGGWTGTTAGGYLHQRLGPCYVSIGLVFHEGAISSDFERPAPHRISAPPPGFLDTTLGKARHADYLLDLRAPAPRPVRDWLGGQTTKRMILPSYKDDNDGSAYNMTVPSLLGAFDALVHIRTTTASHLFAS